MGEGVLRVQTGQKDGGEKKSKQILSESAIMKPNLHMLTKHTFQVLLAYFGLK